MIRLTKGNLLNSDAEALLNAPNTEGALGKGDGLWTDTDRAQASVRQVDDLRRHPLGKPKQISGLGATQLVQKIEQSTMRCPR